MSVSESEGREVIVEKLCRHYFSSKNLRGNDSALFPALSPLERTETNVWRGRVQPEGRRRVFLKAAREETSQIPPLLVSCYNFHERADAFRARFSPPHKASSTIRPKLVMQPFASPTPCSLFFLSLSLDTRNFNLRRTACPNSGGKFSLREGENWGKGESMERDNRRRRLIENWNWIGS